MGQSIFAHLTAMGKWTLKYAWHALRLTFSWKTVAQWFSVKSIFVAIQVFFLNDLITPCSNQILHVAC